MKLSSISKFTISTLATIAIATSLVYALSFPSGAPDATQVPGGKFRTELDDLSGAINLKQSRITGSCLGGKAISAINADGTVTCVTAGGGYAPGSISKTSPGSFSFTVPTGVTTLEVEVWGAGGGGSAGWKSQNYTGYWTYTTGGAGGSGYKTLWTITVTAWQVISGNVGSGGWGNTTIETIKETYGYWGNGWNSSFQSIAANGWNGGRGHDYYCNWGSCNGNISCVSPNNAAGGNVGGTCISGNVTGPAGGAIVASVYPAVTGGGMGGAGGNGAAVWVNGNDWKIYIKW